MATRPDWDEELAYDRCAVCDGPLQKGIWGWSHMNRDDATHDPQPRSAFWAEEMEER